MYIYFIDKLWQSVLVEFSLVQKICKIILIKILVLTFKLFCILARG
jgi:sporulation protein YlmC with PRC-barrel domain